MGYIKCVILCLLFIVVCTLAYPWSESSALTDLHRTDCDKDDVTQILCQRCAKATKSTIVYPMCCEDKDGAKNWCLDYLTFGIQGQ